MSVYVTHVSAGTRVVEAKGDISDVIANIDIEKTPLFSRLRRRSVQDIKPQVIEDSLASVSSSNYHAQTAVAPDASDTTRALIYNWTQIFMTTAEVTDTQNAIAQYGLSKELLYQEAKKMKEHARDIEGFILSDQARQEPTLANGSVGKMAGMSSIISTTTRAISGFSQTNYDTDLGTVVAAGGNPRVAYMDATHKILVDAWTTTPTRFTTDIRTIVKPIDVYISTLGAPVEMIWHHLMPKDYSSSAAHMLVLDLDHWELPVLQPTFRSTLPYEGAGPSTLIKTELTILCSAEQANFQNY